MSSLEQGGPGQPGRQLAEGTAGNFNVHRSVNGEAATTGRPTEGTENTSDNGLFGLPDVVGLSLATFPAGPEIVVRSHFAFLRSKVDSKVDVKILEKETFRPSNSRFSLLVYLFGGPVCMFSNTPDNPFSANSAGPGFGAHRCTQPIDHGRDHMRAFVPARILAPFSVFFHVYRGGLVEQRAGSRRCAQID
ncbi:N-methyltryptophan oxidase [Anopheles sinensis]|uniref:N-methyltryptophan oxidase n=1 Tax=Anopheles sinensis TaxID=74873 RepID=A0A084VED2_ANOSI|nr:N-methyltryptophan oxidase [Anopheles sinensis]